MRGVGDELPLSIEHRQRVATGIVERTEHPLERSSELGHLVLGLGMGETEARIARPLDLPSSVAELGDRAHGPLRRGQARQQGQDRDTENSQPQEHAHPGDRVVEVRKGPRVEQEQPA